eukprot:8629442-Lingulodinium_polyedra.AAC.1
MPGAPPPTQGTPAPPGRAHAQPSLACRSCPQGMPPLLPGPLPACCGARPAPAAVGEIPTRGALGSIAQAQPAIRPHN